MTKALAIFAFLLLLWIIAQIQGWIPSAADGVMDLP
jgi:hypothetical protein